MPTLKLNGQEVEFTQGETIIQVCDREGIEVPRFCYHDRLKIAGNCRMCLVEVKPGPPKPQASCALPAAPNMEVFTDTPMVKKAREGAMEFLLINHPLDCPVCDQGGECDLQDQAVAYGCGTSRYTEEKRIVPNKYMGPLIKTEMTRCIHCTRCIRFIDEVAGTPELGAVGRGEHMEITSYLEKALTSELAGNLVDLCPVGALTSKPYTFRARPWELKHTESIDVLDAVGSNIRIDTRGEAVMRILPRINEAVNEEWISDKTRHACDGLKAQRLDRPYVRKDGKLTEATWDEALAVVAEKIRATKPEAMAALVGNLVSVEPIFALKQLMTSLGVANLECRQDAAKIPASYRGDYIMNTPIADIETADVVLMIGTNPRREAPLINTRLRKAYLRGGMKAYNIGESFPLTYPVEQLGTNPQMIADLQSAAHPVHAALKNAERPVILLGAGALARGDGAAVLAATKQLAELCQRDGWNGFNLLHHAAARVGALDVGFVPQAGGHDMAGIVDGIAKKSISLVYLMGVDELDMQHLGEAFVVYQGHHGDAGAHRADVIFPAAAYTEQDGLYVNTEGRVQEAQQVIFPPKEAIADWLVVEKLAAYLGKPLAYATQADLRAALVAAFPHFGERDVVHPSPLQANAQPAGDIRAETFDYPVRNFYMTDPICRASKTMAQCMEVDQTTRSQAKVA